MIGIVEISISMLLWGITTSLYPCLFPLLPSFMSMTMHTDENRLKGLISGISLTLGLLTTFFIVALFIKLSISQVLDFLVYSNIDFNVLISIIIFISAIIILIGPEKLPLVNSAPQVAHRFLEDAKEESYITAYTMGLVYTLIAAPCAFPVFLSAFTLISSLPAFDATFAIIVYSLGAGLPFILIGVLIPEVKQTIFKKYQFIAPKIKYFSAWLLIMLSIYLFDQYYFRYNPISIGSIFYNGLPYTLWEFFFILLIGGLIMLALITLIVVIILVRQEKRKLKQPV